MSEPQIALEYIVLLTDLGDDDITRSKVNKRHD
mgnify:CR=1 FL=1